MTLYDTTDGRRQVRRLSDGCRTAVGLSDGRTVGHCRTVGLLSDYCRISLSDCHTGAQGSSHNCTCGGSCACGGPQASGARRARRCGGK